MTRMLAVLSVVVLSAGAMQVRAQHVPSTGDGPTCNDGQGPVCRIQTVERCTRWVITSGGGGLNPYPAIKITYECQSWEKHETRLYYI